MVTLTTERLKITPLTLKDAELLNAWHNDPELAYYDDDEPEPLEETPIEETQRWLHLLLDVNPKPHIIHYAIRRREDDRFIGTGQIAYVDRYNRRCKLGITMGERDVWGQGYARETLTAIIAYCFTELDLNRIGASIYDFNERSIRLFEGLGFVREGVIRENVLKRGEFRDEYVYGLLQSEWEARQAL